MRIAIYFSIALFLVLFGALSIFIVPMDSEALVLRGADVKRKVGPGLHIRAPFIENVVIKPVLREQRFSYDTAFEIQGCQAAVSMVYRIVDLEAYHASGGDLMALKDKRHAIEMSLVDLPNLSGFAKSDKAFAHQISEHLRPLAGAVAGGLDINRIHVTLVDGCEPKRIVKETPLPFLVAQPAVVFAPERTAPGNLSATTSDGVELLIEGFVPTYQINDASRVATCFGQNSSIIAIRIGSVAEMAVRRVVEKLTLARMAEFPKRLLEELRENDIGKCGLSFGAVDFNEATFARKSFVNCEETPIKDCIAEPFVIPGLSAQD